MCNYFANNHDFQLKQKEAKQFIQGGEQGFLQHDWFAVKFEHSNIVLLNLVL